MMAMESGPDMVRVERDGGGHHGTHHGAHHGTHHAPIHHAHVLSHTPIQHTHVPHNTPIQLTTPSYHTPIKPYKKEAHPYSYEYGVSNDYTGTNFQENRSQNKEGVVTGSYSVLLPDGRLQTVTYHADHHGGYVAEVTYQGTAVYPEPTPAYPRVGAHTPGYHHVPSTVKPTYEEAPLPVYQKKALPSYQKTLPVTFEEEK